MIELKGITWDHARGYDPVVATAEAGAGAGAIKAAGAAAVLAARVTEQGDGCGNAGVGAQWRFFCACGRAGRSAG